MKYYAIGDVHGQMVKLDYVLREIDKTISEEDKIVFLGDLVDRGKQSMEVVSTVKELVESGRSICVLGNHDYMFIQCNKPKLTHDELWWKQGYAKSAFQSYYGATGFNTKALIEHVSFLKTLPLYYETPTFIFNHSGGNPYLSIKNHTRDDWIWLRPNKDAGIEGKYNVHGHTPSEEIFIGDHRANLDSGAAWGDSPLTCVVWEEGNTVPLQIIQSGKNG